VESARLACPRDSLIMHVIPSFSDMRNAVSKTQDNKHSTVPPKTMNVQLFHVNILRVNVPSRGMRYHPKYVQASNPQNSPNQSAKRPQTPQSNHASPKKEEYISIYIRIISHNVILVTKSVRSHQTVLPCFPGIRAGQNVSRRQKYSGSDGRTHAISAHLHGRSLGKAPIHQEPPLVSRDRRDVVVPVWRGRTDVPLGRGR